MSGGGRSAGGPGPGGESPLLSEDDCLFDVLPAEEASGRPLARLAAMLARDRLPQTLLLAGPAGSGKRHAAVRLAQLLACAAPESTGPCLACEACRRTERGLDPDLILLAPPRDARSGRLKTEIPVEQVRALQERLSFRSSGQRRIAIVDPADRLSPVAQEAMLKTLEEPPPQASVILLTARPQSLKATVLSRCRLLRTSPVSAQALAGLLAARGVPEEAARLAAALSGGDLRRALAVDGEAAGESWLEMARALYELLGPRGESRGRDLALDLAPAAGEGPALLEERLDLLQRILRDVMLAGASADADADADAEADGAQPLADRLTHPGGEKAARALAARLAPGAAAAAVDELERARADLRLRMNTKVVLTSLLLSLHGRRTRRAS